MTMTLSVFHVKHLSRLTTVLFLFASAASIAQDIPKEDAFAQLGTLLPTPTTTRNASGAPGPDYWQQRVDYNMTVEIDEESHKLTGDEIITYHNNSPDALDYLWVQLDQNMRAKDSDSYSTHPSKLGDRATPRHLRGLVPWFEGGFVLHYVTDQEDTELPYTVNKTMMRIDLPEAIEPGQSFVFKIGWHYTINDRMKIGGRSGYELFEEENNALYTIAQFYPRLCAYNDLEGWQNKQFLGRGEFTLEFGDYDVEITVPADHLVAATGTLTNEKDVLSSEHRKRLKQARKEFEQPVVIHTQEEAEEIETGRSTEMKTWTFQADNVRDFAFASSRKFIWDAMAVKQSDGTTVMAMSMYPKEGNPLWERYSTKAVAHTLKWYSHYTFDYPYPVAWSINADRMGMEYPMICFNFGRCEPDGTYSERVKYGMISVIIHEVGHNYFPMIVNSDERQWTWMDEGLNSFVQYLTESQWSHNYPSRRGPAYKIVDYMKSDDDMMVPIMTNSESILQFGNNAYGKPATALNILRESVMGRDLFDHAFKTYARRWMFKQPYPADFFRTIENASGVDLDWFWRGWFYTTDRVDQELANVTEKTVDDFSDEVREAIVDEKTAIHNQYISNIRNAEEIDETYEESDPSIVDFYSTYNRYAPTDESERRHLTLTESLDENEREYLDQYQYFYEVKIKNNEGLVMPVILQFDFEDGSQQTTRIPAEIWRSDNRSFSKVFPMKKRVSKITLDPFLEIADVDMSNNYYPRRQQSPSRFELFKRNNRRQQPNPMQEAQKKRNQQ